MGILPPDPKLKRETIDAVVWEFLKGGADRDDFPLLKAIDGVPIKLNNNGIRGMMLFRPTGVELMDLDTDREGTSALRPFFDAIERHYESIIVWRPREVIERYLMNRRQGWDEHMDWRMGEKAHGLRRVKPSA